MISRLKTLELHGYKTFASKTIFEFPGKITAIVGPNGSGKSNISDSIRWVLGEQSYRLLRGRKTEDMIFAGSEGRSRAGMASSTIIFNNEDGWLPIDFSEVSVMRRAYRDGQNEYLLNGQRIRLRDIQELFAQSGLAERTYTLIGQGLVDSALSIRADERRKFFEEAAGIGLYRSRREDSLNRLEQTRHNLERVTDILSELEPRLKSLERQSRRFREYKTLQADLQVLLRIWYGYHWNNAQKELAQARQIFQDREVNVNEVKNEFEKIDAKLSIVRDGISNKRYQLNDWHTESSSFHLELEKIIRDLAVLEERQRSIRDQEYNQNNDLIRLDEEIKSRENNLQTLVSEHQKLTLEVTEAKNNLEKEQKTLNERMSNRVKLDQTISKARRLLVENESRSFESKAKLNELDERIKNLKNSQEKINVDSQSIQSEMIDKENNYGQAKEELIQIENALSMSKEKTEGLSSKIQEIERKLNQTRDIFNKLQAEGIKLNAQYEALVEAEKNLSGINDGAKNLINANRKGKFSGKYQPFNEILTVPQELELAIDAALGEYLDSIVLLDKTDPSIAIQYLSTGEQGRVILLPVHQLKNKSTNEKTKIDGLVGRASELVKYDETYNLVVENLLGNTIVVKTHEQALSAIGKYSPDMRIVTLNGEIFQGNGVIIAGRDSKASIISRPRQKQEIHELITENHKNNSIVQVELDELQTQIQEITSERTKLSDEVKNLNSELQQKQKKVNETNLEFEKVKQRKSWMENQTGLINQQIASSLESKKNIKENLDEINSKIEFHKNEISDVRNQLSNIPVDELQNSVGHWKTNLAVVERASGEAQKRINENKSNIEQNKQRYKSLKRRLEDFQSSLAEIDDEKAIMRARESDFQVKIEKLRENILPAEEDLKIQEKSLEKLQSEYSNAQQKVSVAERYLTQGQFDYARTKDTLENLRRHIEEDFGLVSFEYSSSISGPNPLPFDGLVEELQIVSELDPNLEENINRQRAQMRRIGPINPEAEEEYVSVKERHEFLSTQVEDLRKADSDLRQVIAELDELMQNEFRKTFDAVAQEFKELFTRLFGGGSAKLYLTDEENFNNTGIEIEAKLPGRREQGLSLLSGGERSLTAVALIFSLLKVSPTPFCVLDEVDAALDEANVGRFCDLLRELSETIQFIVITHNRNTVQAADVIYGITMGRDSSSQVISLRLDEVSDELVK